MRLLESCPLSVSVTQFTFEPLVNSSDIWQRDRGLGNNYIPANGTEIDSWVMETNPVNILMEEKESAFIC